MKKTITIALALSSVLAYAQDGKVGINTEKPTATLNVKSKTGKDETTINLQLQNADSKNLVKVLDNGNVGIGVDTPSENLEVKGNIKIQELSGTNDRIVVADKNGVLKTQLLHIRGSVVCNKDNENKIYLSPEGSFLCEKRSDQYSGYKWTYRGAYLKLSAAKNALENVPIEIHEGTAGKAVVNGLILKSTSINSYMWNKYELVTGEEIYINNMWLMKGIY